MLHPSMMSILIVAKSKKLTKLFICTRNHKQFIAIENLTFLLVWFIILVLFSSFMEIIIR